MGTVFLHGNGGSGGSGGGMELTIIVDTVRPAKVTHNAIWVDSDVDATSYALTAAEPENPEAGALWISIGDGGKIKVVSPVGDNWITVYPISAKQFIDGEWVTKVAKSYQNGEWVDWTVFAYNGGNTGWQSCTSAVGGWYPGSVTFSDGAICLKNTETNSATGSATTEKYDLSSFKTIEFVIDSQSTGFNTGAAYVCVTTSNSFAWNPGTSATTLPSEAVSSKQFSSSGTVTLDVSSLSGEYYLAILITKVKTVYCTKVSMKL